MGRSRKKYHKSLALGGGNAKTLYHCKGCENPYKTILTEKELCETLINVRNKLQEKK